MGTTPAARSKTASFEDLPDGLIFIGARGQGSGVGSERRRAKAAVNPRRYTSPFPSPADLVLDPVLQRVATVGAVPTVGFSFKNTRLIQPSKQRTNRDYLTPGY